MSLNLIICLFQLSGWTSNLIDTIMDHHFSTVRTDEDTGETDETCAQL